MESRDLFLRAERWMRAGDQARWRVCWIASVIVGRHEFGATLALASAIGRSVDTVESMARAAQTARDLWRAHRSEPESITRLRELRRELSWSHWTAIGRLMRARGMSPRDALAALDLAARERLSVREMTGAALDALAAEAPEQERLHDLLAAIQSLLRAARRARAAAERAAGDDAALSAIVADAAASVYDRLAVVKETMYAV